VAAQSARWRSTACCTTKPKQKVSERVNTTPEERQFKAEVHVRRPAHVTSGETATPLTNGW